MTTETGNLQLLDILNNVGSQRHAAALRFEKLPETGCRKGFNAKCTFERELQTLRRSYRACDFQVSESYDCPIAFIDIIGQAEFDDFKIHEIGGNSVIGVQCKTGWMRQVSDVIQCQWLLRDGPQIR